MKFQLNPIYLFFIVFIFAGQLPLWGQIPGIIDDYPGEGLGHPAIKVIQSCGDDSGKLIVDENFIPSNSTYYWLDTGLPGSRSGLGPGFYALIIVDENGCIEKHDFLIMEYDSCEFEFQASYFREEVNEIDGWDGCVMELKALVKVGDHYLHENAYKVYWENLSQRPSFNYYNQYAEFPNHPRAHYDMCVHFSLLFGPPCCSDTTICFEVPNPIECPVEDPNDNESRIIVNEVGGVNGVLPGFDYTPFIELLVIGNGECNGTTDIRRIIVNNNDGSVIIKEFADSLWSETHLNDYGYLRFQNISHWSYVPNGSLIVLFDGDNNPQNFKEQIFPSDSNVVYFIDVNNTELLDGYLGTESSETNSLTYMGDKISPEWKLIDPNVNDAEFIHTRHRTHRMDHGLVYKVGETTISDSTVIIIDGYSSGNNCSLIGADYNNSSDFSCTNLFNTPGKPNSRENENLINSLRFCNDTTEVPIAPLLDNESILESFEILTKSDEQSFRVFPNPYHSGFFIEYQSPLNGGFKLNIYSTDGRVQQDEQWTGDGVGLEYFYSENLPSGFYIIELTFPNEVIERKTLIKIK